ncbi:TetR/AcrR family transcriptional regulator [Nocardia gipuzkoensis]
MEIGDDQFRHRRSGAQDARCDPAYRTRSAQYQHSHDERSSHRFTVVIVNKVGRPSKARERKVEILRAIAGVVARDGLANATLSRVAEAAGMQRTLVLHYFGSRDGLTRAFVAEAVAAYGSAMLRTTATEPVAVRIDAMFEPGAYRSREDLIVWIELVALSARDPQVRAQLRVWMHRWLPEFEHQLHEDFPHANDDRIAMAAYALACLFEAHWAFDLQDVAGPQRHSQAKRAAHAVLATLAS